MKNLSTLCPSPLLKNPFLIFLRKFGLRDAEGGKSRVVFFIFLWILSFNWAPSTNFSFAAEKIDINAAPLDDLVKIIHIGEARALELISLRPFSSLDDLIRIKGIGPARLEDIKKQGIAYVESTSKNSTALLETIKPTIEPETEAETTSQQFIGKLSEPMERTAPLAAESKTFPEIKTATPFKIDINAASLQDLEKIVGIGAALSQRIMDMRPFYSLDELAKVRGIGAGTLENIKKQGLAWVDSGFTPPKKEKNEPFDKELTKASVPLQQIQDRQFPKNFSVFLTALVLAFFSGTIILILKRNLKTLS